MSQKSIFFAYEDGHLDNRDAITRASDEYNRHQKTFKIIKWEDLRISGNIISKNIFEHIKKCDKFSCDLTYLNHNVLFELGYAIAQRKILKIFLNPNIIDAKRNYFDLKILKDIGFTPFSTSKEILKEFQNSKSEDECILLEKIIPGYDKIQIANDIFFINIKNKNQAAIDTEELLKLLSINFISNYEDEISYQTLLWYLNSILKSEIILLHMVGNDKTDYKAINAEYSLYAGLSYGLGKKLLMIAPCPFRAPIDYADILIEYVSAEDCTNKIEAWLHHHREHKLKTIENVQVTEAIVDDEMKKLNLLRLGIGLGVAEKDGLLSSDIFIENDAYYETLRRNKLVVIGRKGTGKTEIFQRLQEDLSADKNNYNIIIKPDSDEMLSNVELSSLYNNERSKKAFLSTVWQYVINAKLFLQIKEHLNELEIDELERKNIEIFYNENKDMLTNNFYGMILFISNAFKNNNIMQEPSLLDKIKKRIFPMLNIIKSFFSQRKYQKINIMADNLDSGWESSSNLELQSLMIICLIEYMDILNSQYSNNQNLKIHSVIFLRRDIFNFILRKVREPDKMAIDTFEISWEKFPGQLKNVIEKRMQKVLNIKESAEQIWKEYFNFKNNKMPFDTILMYIVKRPRDVIYFISKLFESAVNNNKLKINDTDLQYAIDAYTRYLYNNLIAELKAEFPLIEEIIKELQNNYSSLLNQFTLIPLDNFYKILQMHIEKDNADRLLKTMMDNSYLVGFIKKNNQVITNYEELNVAISKKIFKVFKKNKVLLNMRLIPFAG
jgi:hypothetical protein